MMLVDQEMQLQAFLPRASQLVRAGLPLPFLKEVNQALASLPFKPLQAGLTEALKDEPNTRAFLLTCLEPLVTEDSSKPSEAKWSSALPYLLLDVIPSAHTQASYDSAAVQIPIAEDGSTQDAVGVIYKCILAGNVKAAVRLAQAYNVNSSHVEQQPEVLQALRECLANLLASGRPGLTPAVGLMLQFNILVEYIDVKSTLSDLVSAGLENLAEKWLQHLNRDDQVTYVELCLAADKLKSASRVVRTYGLQDTFPDVEKIYKARTLSRLVDRGLWTVAAQYVGSDRAMQEQVVTAMADHDPQQAQEWAQQWGLPESLLGPLLHPAARAAAEAARAAQYHQLQLPLSSVYLVKDRSSIAHAHSVLQHASVIGLDVEWRPAGPSRASLLQVATQDHVFLFDLLALLNPTKDVTAPTVADQATAHMEGYITQDAAMQIETQHDSQLMSLMDDCLCSVLQNQACLKLGVEIAGDLRKLAGSWPLVRAFQAAGPILELRDLWTARLAVTNPNVSRLQRSIGLSSLCSNLLGKPLDKSMQVSDWERRPLSTRQVLYAAQDAHVLISLYNKLCELVPDATSVITSKQFDYTAGSSQRPNSADQQGKLKQQRLLDAIPGGSLQGGTPSMALTEDQQMETDTPGTILQTSVVQPILQPSQNQAAFGSIISQGSGQVGIQNQPQNAVNGDAQQDTSTTDGNSSAAVMGALAAAGLLDCFLQVPEAAAASGPGTATAVAAAHILGVSLTAVAKCMALMITTHHHHRHNTKTPQPAAPQHSQQDLPTPRLVILRGDHRLNMQKVATSFGVPRKCVRMATADECLNVFGYQPGCMPPMGLSTPVSNIMIDQTLQHVHGSVPAQQHDEALALQNNPPGDSTETAAAMHASTSLLDPAAESHANHSSLQDNTQHNRHLLYTGAGVIDAVLAITLDHLVACTGGRLADVAALPAGQQQQPKACQAAPPGISAVDDNQTQQGQQATGMNGTTSTNGLKKEVSFLVDAMLGRLCRWLRCLGVDAELVAKPMGRAELLQAAATSGRILLTRDVRLAVRRDAAVAGTYLLNSDDPGDQLREVANHFGVTFEESKAMSRCAVCNAAAFEVLSPEEAQPLVPEKVFQEIQEFFRCRSCGKVYWMGPKSFSAMARVENVLSGAAT